MKEAFTTEEAAARLGVTDARVRQLIRGGILDAKQFGRAYVITAAAIEAARQRHDKPGPVPKKQVGTKDRAGNGTSSRKSASKKGGVR